MRQYGSALSIMMLLVLTACQSLPTVTRSGDVKDVTIREGLSSPELQVNAGDEIRWTNKRMAPARIVFLDPVSDRLSCRNNFGGMFSSNSEATLKPNQSASVCFREPGTIRYVVKMDSAVPTGQVSDSGRIQIGASPGRTSPYEERSGSVTTGSPSNQ
jgi:plastocyanin